MLIILPTTAMTQKASDWLTSQQVAHQVIPVPEILGYKTGSDVAIFLDSTDNMDIPMRLSREKFVVMRVFREFDMPSSPESPAAPEVDA